MLFFVSCYNFIASYDRRIDKNIVFSNHSAVIREQICTLHQSRDFFVINIIRRRRESGISISFNDS